VEKKLSPGARGPGGCDSVPSNDLYRPVKRAIASRLTESKSLPAGRWLGSLVATAVAITPDDKSQGRPEVGLACRQVVASKAASLRGRSR
jgi:hypothetical protein